MQIEDKVLLPVHLIYMYSLFSLEFLNTVKSLLHKLAIFFRDIALRVQILRQIRHFAQGLKDECSA